MKTKICSTCKLDKPVDEYFKNSRMKDGLQPRCKTCAAEYLKKPETLAKYVAYSKRISRRNRDLLNEYKQQRGCTTCPETEAACLDFHHKDRNEKDFEVGNLGSYAWSTIMKEIDKCILVCANCHRKIHAGILKI
jgi:hypothetical protein